MKPDFSAQSNFRWLKTEHHDLLFWGIKPPLPWPKEDDKKIDPQKHFPFERLLEGIERLRQAGTGWSEEWDAVKTFIERGDELGEALESGDMTATLRLLDELETLRPGTPYCAFNKAFALKSLGDKEAALEAAKQATQREPKLEYLWMQRANLHEELGGTEHEEKAAYCFRKALGLLPNHKQALEGLARLGKMIAVQEILPDGTQSRHFVTPEQFQKYIETNVKRQAADSPMLRDLLTQFDQPHQAGMALTVLDRILTGNPPDALTLRLRRAEALRLLKRVKQAETLLKQILKEDPDNAEAYYIQAWCHFDSGRNEKGWDGIRDTLLLNPNHQKALMVKFRMGPNNKDPGLIERLSQWAEARKSWRAHWLASVHAAMLDDNAAALRCAEAAYKLAPQEREALFLYANCLNTMDEGEYTAALVHPRLPEAKGDYVLKFIFAGAMKKLGLPDMAIRVLKEALEEESDMDAEWRQNTQHFLDSLLGLIAESEVDLEFHPNTDILRREVWLGDDKGPGTPFLQSAVPLPLERQVKMNPRPGFTGTTGSVAVFHHSRHSGLDPTSLGWFQAHDIDFSAEELPHMTLTVRKNSRKLEASARQGERRLPVTWSLYRAPSMEYDPSTSDPD